MKNLKLLCLLPLLGLFAIPAARAQSPGLVYCVTASSIMCNSVSNPGSGNQGDPAWQAFGKVNANFLFLESLWALPANSLVGSQGFGTIVPISIGANLSLVAGVLSATGGGGGGTPGGSAFSLQYNNSGVFGGILPGSTGTYCLNWPVLPGAPILVSCPGGGTVTNFSFTNANGFIGGVSNSSSTPALTLSPAFTGIAYSNGSGFAPAVAGNFPTINLANNIAGGLAGEIPYQTAANTTGFTPQPTVAGTSPVWNGSAYVFQAAAGSVNACANSNYIGYYASAGSVVSCAPLGNALTLNGGVLNVASLVNPQTGTTYAISTTDNSKLVTRANAANMADTIVAATTTGYGAGFAFDITNYGPGIVTLTPTTSTIGGLATLVVPPNQGCSVVSDGTNYQVSACDQLLTDNAGGAGASVTPSCAIDNEDTYGTFTATAGTFTVNAPTGCVPFEGQRLRMHFKFTNAQTYSWNAAFVGGTSALPTSSTGSSKGDWVGFLYDSINAKWDYVATATGF